MRTLRRYFELKVVGGGMARDGFLGGSKDKMDKAKKRGWNIPGKGCRWLEMRKSKSLRTTKLCWMWLPCGRNEEQGA